MPPKPRVLILTILWKMTPLHIWHHSPFKWKVTRIFYSWFLKFILLSIDQITKNSYVGTKPAIVLNTHINLTLPNDIWTSTFENTMQLEHLWCTNFYYFTCFQDWALINEHFNPEYESHDGKWKSLRWFITSASQKCWFKSLVIKQSHVRTEPDLVLTYN